MAIFKRHISHILKYGKDNLNMFLCFNMFVKNYCQKSQPNLRFESINVKIKQLKKGSSLENTNYYKKLKIIVKG